MSGSHLDPIETASLESDLDFSWTECAGPYVWGDGWDVFADRDVRIGVTAVQFWSVE